MMCFNAHRTSPSGLSGINSINQHSSSALLIEEGLHDNASSPDFNLADTEKGKVDIEELMKTFDHQEVR